MHSAIQQGWFSLTRVANFGLLSISHWLKRIEVWGMPGYVMIEPTNACNARCPLCPTGAGQISRPAKMMALDVFKRLVDEIYPYVHSLNLWNLGEPFLNRQAFEMIRYAQEHSVRVKVSTNGWVLYQPENIGQLIDSRLDHLIVSLDGATAETFNQYRVGVDFERVMTGLRLLRDEKTRRHVTHPVVEWQFIVMRHNEHEIEAARHLAREAGAIFSLKTVGVPASAPTLFERFLPSNKELTRYAQKKDGTYELTVERKNDCYLLWHSLVVNADGQVIPCCWDYYDELPLGNANRQTIRQIWNGPQMQTLRRRIVTDRNALSPCAECTVDARPALSLTAPRTRLGRLWSRYTHARKD